MTRPLISSTSFLCLLITQISPLRPQRPRSQVLQIGGDRRLSVSPGPPSSSSNSTSSPGPPPITPRSKLSFSLHTVSSKSSFSLLNTRSVVKLERPQPQPPSCVTVTTCCCTCDDAQFDLKHGAVCVILATLL